MVSSLARRFALPPPSLWPFVERIWSWKGGAGTALPRLLPGTGAELVLHAAAPFDVVEGGVRRSLPTAHFLSPRLGAPQLLTHGPVDFVAIRFRVGALPCFTATPHQALFDRFAPAEEVLGPAAAGLARAVARAGGFAARALAVEAFLLAALRRRGASPGLAAWAVPRLYRCAGRERVRDAAQALGASERQLERAVRAATGLTPKRLQRLARFHHVVRALLLEQRPDYLGAALDRGYYDQAHFIHEVGALTGLTPRQILTPAAFRSHFYNPPLAPPGHAPVLITEEDDHGNPEREADGAGRP